MRISSAIVAASLLISSSALAVDPSPKFGAKPAWVEDTTIPKPDPKRNSVPAQLLLTNGQHRLTTKGTQSFVRYSIIPQTVAGLQMAGTVAIPWQPEKMDLTVHWIDIIRNGSRIHQLRPDDVLVLRREENLEKAMLDGIRTVVSPLRGLQIGDIVDVAFTYNSETKLIGSRPDEVLPTHPSFSILEVQHRVLVADGLSIKWKVPDGSVTPTAKKDGGFTEYRMVRNSIEPLQLRSDVPDRFRQPFIQYSSYDSWSDVAEELLPAFEEARRPKPNSALLQETKRIAAMTDDPARRMMLALRSAQDQVRYVALLLGDGAYRPQSADDTWDLRFGDCKGKTALLLAMLGEMGIEAEPLLVSNRFDDSLSTSIPSLAIFDHVIVRAKLGGKYYYLDPTDYGQRVIDDVAGSSFRMGLPLVRQATLEKNPLLPMELPLSEVSLEWDYSNGLDEKVPAVAVVTLRGWEAAEMRGAMANADDPEKFATKLKNLVPAIKNDDLEILGVDPDLADGSFRARFKSDSKMDWSPFEGEKETRFGFNNGATFWKPKFDREKAEGVDLPYTINSKPSWYRLRETVLLPNGGRGFKVDAAPIDMNILGTVLKRTVAMEGNRVTMTADMKSDVREVTAEAALAAKDELEALHDENAWIVGPKEKKTKKK